MCFVVFTFFLHCLWWSHGINNKWFLLLSFFLKLCNCINLYHSCYCHCCYLVKSQIFTHNGPVRTKMVLLDVWILLHEDIIRVSSNILSLITHVDIPHCAPLHGNRSDMSWCTLINSVANYVLIKKVNSVSLLVPAWEMDVLGFIID